MKIQCEDIKVQRAEHKETFKNIFLSALLHTRVQYHNTHLLEVDRKEARHHWSVVSVT